MAAQGLDLAGVDLAGVDLEWGEVLPTSGRGRAPRPEANPPVRVRRGRAALVAFAMSAVVAVGAAGAAAGSPAAPPGADPGAATTVVVAPGDTLWGLAARHAPPGADPQAWALRVMSDNGVDAGALVPGSVLVIPDDGSGNGP